MRSGSTDSDEIPLVLLHGLTASARVWAPVMPLLAGRPVYVPTLPGHRGGLPVDPKSVTFHGLVDAVCHQLDAAGIDQAHIAGNSFGGWIALELAHRSRAVSVLAISPAGGWSSPKDLQRLLRLFQLAGAIGTSRAVRLMARGHTGRRALLGMTVANPGRVSARDAQTIFEDLAACTVLRPLLSRAEVEGAVQPCEEAPCPTMLAWGDRDRTLPFDRYGTRFLECIPGIESVMLPGVGHVPMWDDPQLIARTIQEWIAAVEKVDGGTAAPAIAEA